MKTSIFFLFCLSTCVLAAAEQKEPAPVVLDIAKAESIALRYAPKIGAAYFKSEASKQQIIEARSALFPQITGIVSLAGAGTDNSADVARIGASGGLNNPSVRNRESEGVMVSQLITDFGRTSNLISVARFESLSQQEKTGLVRAQVIQMVDATYFRILGAHALLQVANETVSARQLVVDQVSELTKAKLKSDLDLSFAKVDLANARLLVLQAQNAVGNAEADLSAAFGYHELHHFVLVEESQYLPEKTDIEPLILQALKYRPELVALRDEYQGAVKFSAAEREAHYPVISAIGTIGYTPSGAASMKGDYSAGAINVELPIFTGGRLTARAREAELNAKAVNKDLEDWEDEVVKEVNEAWLDALTAFDKIQVTKDLVANAQQALELAQSRYKLGLNSIIELSQAQLNATQAEIGYASAKYEYQVDRVKLEFDTGALKYRTPIPQFH